MTGGWRDPSGIRSALRRATGVITGLLLGCLLAGTAMAQAGSPLAGTRPVEPLPATTAMHAPATELSTSRPTPQAQPTSGGYSAAGGAAAGSAGAAQGAGQPVPASIGADYRIGANDLLEVQVFGVSELTRTVRVNSTGHVSLPLIGMIPVAGLSPPDAEALIALEYGKQYLQDPQVSIFIKEFTSQRITVDGAVMRPGIYPLTGQITLLRALAMAGGGSQLADLEHVMLFRLGPQGQSLSEKYDVLKIRTGEAPDPVLQGDDVVVVNRDSARTALRDSLFSDIIGTLNPFSAIYRNAAVP